MTGPTSTTRRLVHARAGGRCERCGASLSDGGDVHHRKPRGMGGTHRAAANAPSVLVHLCRTCHAWVESYRSTAIADGWLIESYGPDPRTVPILLASLAMLVWLDDVGGYLLDAPDANQFVT